MMTSFRYGTYLYSKGYYEIVVKGNVQERLLNECMLHDIHLVNIRRIEKEYHFAISYSEYQKLLELPSLGRWQPEIKEKHGIPFLFLYCKAHPSYLFGFTLALCLIFYLSVHIWNIRFEDNHKYTNDSLNQFLSESGIRVGMPIWFVSCADIEERIRDSFDDITWVSAQISGTCLVIRIKENALEDHSLSKAEEPADIIAEEAAQISSIIVRSGIGQVKKGDRVEKGQLLVSGMVPVTNDNEEIIHWHQVHADAEIEGITKEEYYLVYPLSHVRYVKCGKKQTDYGIRIGPYQVDLPALHQTEKKQADASFEQTTVRQVCLFEDFYLPLWVSRKSSNYYQGYEEVYTSDQKNRCKELYHFAVLQKISQKGVHIIRNNVKIKNNKSNWQVIVSVDLQKPIGTSQEMKNAEEITQPDEHN